MKLSYVKSYNNEETIKQVLKEKFEISDRLLLKLKKEQKIFVNKIPSFVNYSLKNGDILEVFIDFEEDNSNIVPTKMNLDFLYEDEAMLILNKPAGVAIHPSCRHFDSSLSNGVKFYFDSIGLSKKIRPVNRLDKDTSGIVIFAKNEYIQESLVRQMKNKKFKKEYIAILEGTLEKKCGTINQPIARKENSIIERCINEAGDNAITHYQVLDEKDNLSIVSFILETGRTHQIRVHSKFIGHPILGDTLYRKFLFINCKTGIACIQSIVYSSYYKSNYEYNSSSARGYKKSRFASFLINSY